MKFNHRIGYACINMDIADSTYKTCRLSDISDDKLRPIIKHNLTVLSDSIDYNIINHNKMFRVSSSLIPFASHHANTLDWAEEFQAEFEMIKNKIIENDIRISCHPGQYTLINSTNQDVVEAAILDLKYHTKLMDLLSGNRNHKMILHVGGVYGDKDAAIQRFVSNYITLDDSIKKYLVIENDDKLFTVADILSINQETKIPCVFDNLHHICNPSLEGISIKEIMTRIQATWSEADGRLKVHYSQQDLNKRPGAHSQTIDLEQFTLDCETYFDYFDCDIMLEVKDKNRSFMKVELLLNPSKKVREAEWARYKYLVMSKSQKHYNALRMLFKNNESVDVIEMYRLIDEAVRLDENTGSFINAYDHCWGYFKNVSDEKEKATYIKNREAYRIGSKSSASLKSHLKKLSIKYSVKYLQSSYFI